MNRPHCASLYGTIHWFPESRQNISFRLWLSYYGMWRSDRKSGRTGYPLNDAPQVNRVGCTVFRATASSGFQKGFRTAGPIEELASIAEMNGIPGQQFWNNVDAAVTNYMKAQLSAFDARAFRLTKSAQVITPFNTDIGLTADGQVRLYEAHLCVNWKCVF